MEKNKQDQYDYVMYMPARLVRGICKYVWHTVECIDDKLQVATNDTVLYY